MQLSQAAYGPSLELYWDRDMPSMQSHVGVHMNVHGSSPLLPCAMQELQMASVKHEGGYIFPLSAQADAAFEAAWRNEPVNEPEADGAAEAAAPQPEAPVVLPVMFGRTLPVDR